jgi:hypothetical protein
VEWWPGEETGVRYVRWSRLTEYECCVIFDRITERVCQERGTALADMLNVLQSNRGIDANMASSLRSAIICRVRELGVAPPVDVAAGNGQADVPPLQAGKTLKSVWPPLATFFY